MFKKTLFSSCINVTLSCGIALLYIGCQSTPKNFKPSQHSLDQARQITWIGHNTSPEFLNNGRQIIFSSSNRPSHKASHIYFMSNNQTSEKKLTFNKAENSSPVFHPKQSLFFYASDTDRRKNMHSLMKKYRKKSTPPSTLHHSAIGLFPAKDIYSAHLNEQGILRYTKNRNSHFNGFLAVHPSGDSLVFSKQIDSNIHLHRLYFLSKKVLKITNISSINIDPHDSHDGSEMAWVRFKLGENSSEILIANTEGLNPQILKLPHGIYRFPRWSLDNKSLIFSAQINSTDPLSKQKQLYSFHLKTQCLQKLRNDLNNSYDASIHPDGKGLIFVNDHSGQPQIYFSNNFSPIGKCL